MATSWKSQQGKDEYALQFETDNKEKYKLVEKAAQMAVDGKTIADFTEVQHGEWNDRYENKYDNHLYVCSNCGEKALYTFEWDELGHERARQKLTFGCPNCLAIMNGGEA